MNAAIETVGLHRVFDQRQGLFGPQAHVVAVDDINLKIAPGRALGIVGESGCGKSTLARVLLGLLPPSDGTVRVDGPKPGEYGPSRTGQADPTSVPGPDEFVESATPGQ